MGGRLSRGERLWSLARGGRLWTMQTPPSAGELGELYDHLNASRFGGVLPNRIGRVVQVAIGASRLRTSDSRGVLLGQWEPVPLYGQRGRRGWGTIRLFRDADGRTLLHEMIHQALDVTDLPNGHGECFQRVAGEVGYEVTDDDRDQAAAEAVLAGSVACWRRL